ncbi:MAG TPA: START domain-containing protein [Myxococcales bacterium]|nr:START domain-containing protein [Myxococcales bacterium]
MVWLALLLAAGAGWEKTGDEAGVTVWRREVPGSKFLAVKGTGVVDAPPRTVALVLLDDDRAPEWVDSLAEARVVRIVSAAEYIEYNRAAMPLIVSDRDFVNTVSMAVDAASHAVVIRSVPTTDALAPPTKAVRGLLDATYLLEPIDGGKHTRLTVEIESDPKGWLPAWLVNFFQKDWARETIEGIRKQCAKPDLKPPPEFAEFLGQIDF